MGSDPQSMLQAAHHDATSHSFSTLDSMAHFSKINLARALRWHPKGLQSWSMSDWFTALAGEVGELGNVIKKLNRYRDGLTGNKETPLELQKMFDKELADVYIYLDLLAQASYCDLPRAIREKFNETSIKNNFRSDYDSLCSSR